MNGESSTILNADGYVGTVAQANLCQFNIAKEMTVQGKRSGGGYFDAMVTAISPDAVVMQFLKDKTS